MVIIKVILVLYAISNGNIDYIYIYMVFITIYY